MNAVAIERVQRHFDRLPRRGLAQRFYRFLFDAAPALRTVFPDDMTALEIHFEDMLAHVISQLGRVNAVDDALRDLGVRHLRYGAQPHHYPIVRDALLSALAEHADGRWSRQLARDWRLAIAAIMVPMLHGAAVETANTAQAFAAEDGLDDSESR